MVKKEYQAPLCEDMEVLEEEAIVATSFGTDPEFGGEGDPEVIIPD